VSELFFLLKPYQIFTTMNVVDPYLAKDLKAKYIQMWTFDELDAEAFL
jgi:hypothetical protein